ncbi:IclR family transcriptional regulator [Sulfitobacter mediterraneus]|uniref:IclR family transcriptional regulator n=1 Tax=Sulfitobacter mediterraneus TaxID=83219 RepID=UPI001933CF9C|nr:IclR family transcriptional regulator [Sulfitobacter mediterraneus]MBM1634596.1 IclR family transcriptional regulator [Sulfitobacter mediterraneus]MBM1642414.1 IclR family transcriptional regulator [Sulfitobacter mediterraneus]MBM1646462.1 IclR family transcriptional regulator [Sulfitobacter mediterraneus]MBM1650508.1 IclR family transcriptional regulator [Sulfitobacter mediterraneus]MBM1654530.1 IclR family transcriptional regulator [Sulfitobacter mediterraneus]
MSSISKTLELLAYFTSAQPEIGLSQLCRQAGRDKATTYRHLQALEDAGFVEQNPVTKHYRLGPALLQLAQIREETVPRKAGAETVLDGLVDTTGETAHVSVLSGTTVYPLVSRESHHHSTRAIIDVQSFPLHATASGLCALAFGPSELWPAAVAKLQTFTDRTIASKEALQQTVAAVRQSGFGRSDRCYEDDIQGVSAPVFDQSGRFAGAVSVACVASRFTPELEAKVKKQLINASRDITRNWGGAVPAEIEAAWAGSLSRSNVLENTS